ncbi:MAG: Rpn family recombination-promoting nuclease/putative transposase [Prochloron sp. SP5CPC1]|nr:Rpn family recombination-promoting nuclease/putative transposase [Candidatus Paraprochloron terpiosi SP5CPC1]
MYPPEIFFELIGQPYRAGYHFRSIEVKQTAFRIDGVFLPPPDAVDEPVFFVEVQFQKDELLYHRLFGELFMFLAQNPQISGWQAVVIFPRRSLEPEETKLYEPLLSSGQVQRFYLNELLSTEGEFSPTIGLMELIVQPSKQVPELARTLWTQVNQTPETKIPKETILELIETTMVYKFPQLSRQEIAAMLGLAESVKHTRVYQEGREEGRWEGEQKLIIRLLSHRVGAMATALHSQVEALPLEKLEALGEALLDFSEVGDLIRWLETNT